MRGNTERDEQARADLGGNSVQLYLPTFSSDIVFAIRIRGANQFAQTIESVPGDQTSTGIDKQSVQWSTSRMGRAAGVAVPSGTTSTNSWRDEALAAIVKQSASQSISETSPLVGGSILPSVYTYPSNDARGSTFREKFGYPPAPPVLTLARPRPPARDAGRARGDV